MADIITRSSVLAIKEEVTEGTAVAPTAGTDAVALQPDFSMEPGIEVITNDELRASIGQTKPLLGNEAPTASFSHYLRASGVAGQAPNFGLLLKSFFGASSAQVTERDTVASSTVSLIKVDTGEGAEFERGEPLLIQDATNGFSVRHVDSVSTDDLTINFNLANAPASGVLVGQSVLYKPANTGHIPLSLWHYLGNGGKIQMMSGSKVTGFDIDVTSGQLINASFSLEGKEFFVNPILITSSTRYLDWTDDDGTFAAAVTAGWYKTPQALASALQSAMNATASTETATVTYSNSTGKFTIKTTGTVLTLKWNTGANTANTIGTKLGFSVAADDSGTAATTGYISDNAQSLAFPYTASYDSADAVVAKGVEVMFGSATDTTCFGAISASISASNTRVIKQDLCETSGQAGSIITGREVSVAITARLSQYDSGKFDDYINATEKKFQLTFGPKSGTNWTKGSICSVYMPNCSITEYAVDDADGLAILNMTATAFVDDSGNGEFYIGLV